MSQKILRLLHYLVNLDKAALASEIFHIQRDFKLPGLVQEGKELIHYFNLPNILEENLPISKHQWKSKVKMAVHSKYEEQIRIKMSNYSKLKDGPMMSETFEEKSYLTKMTMANARTNFRIRSKMTNVKMNQRSDKLNAKQLWKCDECGNVDTQSHIVWCPFFASSREGKSLDSDIDIFKKC